MLRQLSESTATAPTEPLAAPPYAASEEAPKTGLASMLSSLRDKLADRSTAVPPLPPAEEVVPPYREAEPHDDEVWRPLIDPMKVIGGIVDSKWIIVALTILGAGLGVVAALNTPKKYMAAAEIVADPRDLKLSERDLTQQGLPSDATLALVETQTRILRSGNVLNEVVKKLNLSADPEFNGEDSAGGLSGIISEVRSIFSRSTPGEDEGRRYTLAIENLSRSLTIERGGKTFAIVIAVETKSPDKSAEIANTMTDVFLKSYGQILSGTAGRAADELSGRLDELRKSVEQSEKKVATFKAENDIVDPQGKLITDDEIVKISEQLTTARARVLELNAKADSVKGVDADSILGGAIPESLNSNIITELRSQYAALKSESDRTATRLGPRHPEQQAIDAQLAGARRQIADELRRLTTSIQVELKRAVQLEQELAARQAQLKVRQGDLSTTLVQLRELEREAASNRDVYEAALLRARDAREQSTVNTANMSLITKASPPLDPVGPSRSMIALTGMILGFGSGIGFGAMRGAYVALRDRRNERPARRRYTPVVDMPPDGSPGGGLGRKPVASPTPQGPSTDRPVLSPMAGAATASREEDDPMLKRPPVPHAYDAPMATEGAYAAPHGYHPQQPPAYGYAPQPAQHAYHPHYGPHHQPQQAYVYPVQPMQYQPVPQQVWPAQAYGYAPDPYAPPQYPARQSIHPVHLHQQQVREYEQESRDSRAIAEIRESLAEFREAVRNLSDSRQKKRRYF